LRALTDHPRFCRGSITTQFIQEEWPEGFKGIALSQETGNAYVAQCSLNVHCWCEQNALRMILPNRTVTTPILGATSATVDWPNLSPYAGAPLMSTFCPSGVWVDDWNSALYISEATSHQVRRAAIVRASGALLGLVTLVGHGHGNHGRVDGMLSTLNSPWGLALSADLARVYVADRGSGAIRELAVVTCAAGFYGTGGVDRCLACPVGA
jgi:DNA-binding beta-propeller fold protein YncE